MSKTTVELRKNGGFYCTYGDSAYILYYFFKYKIHDDKVGFPVKVVNKVVNILDENHINYCVTGSDEIKFSRNNYSKYVDLGKKKFSINYRVDSIISKIPTLSEKDIDDVLNYIEAKYEQR